MAYGSCGKEFKDAFSCFHYSEEDPKGSDCVDSFMKMHTCFQEFPEEYGKFADDDDDDHEHSVKEETEQRKGEVVERRGPDNDKHSDATSELPGTLPSLSRSIDNVNVSAAS